MIPGGVTLYAEYSTQIWRAFARAERLQEDKFLIVAVFCHGLYCVHICSDFYVGCVVTGKCYKLGGVFISFVFLPKFRSGSDMLSTSSQIQCDRHTKDTDTQMGNRL